MEQVAGRPAHAVLTGQTLLLRDTHSHFAFQVIDCGEREGERESGVTISIGAVMIHLVPLPLLAVGRSVGRLSLPPPFLPPSASVGSAAGMLPSSSIAGDFLR